jgi:hypothetical protein
MRGTYYNPEELYRVLTAMGFVDVDVRVIGALGFPWGSSPPSRSDFRHFRPPRVFAGWPPILAQTER